VKAEQQALSLVVQQHDQELEKSLRENLAHYEQQAGNRSSR
jgi:hypothetical protein